MNIFEMLKTLVLVSILEEAFLVSFILVLSNCSALIFKKPYKLLIPILSTAFISNILKYYHVNINIVPFVSVVVIYISTMLTYQLFDRKTKLLWSVFFSMLTLQMCEIYIPLEIRFLGKTLLDVQRDPVLSFLISIPERLLEFTILIKCLIKFKDSDEGVFIDMKKLNKRDKIKLVLSFCISMIYLCSLGYCMYTFNLFLKDFKSFITALFFVTIFLSVPIYIIINNWKHIYDVKKTRIIDKENTLVLIECFKFDIMNNNNNIDASEALEKLKEYIAKGGK